MPYKGKFNKEWFAARRASNPQASKEAWTKYRLGHKEICKARTKAWRDSNPEKIKEYTRSHYLKLKSLGKHLPASPSKHRMNIATPKWADKQAINKIYLTVRALSLRDDVSYHVDHFYPLAGKTMCGLHVASNLRITLAEYNMKKHNNIEEASFAA